MRLAFFLFLALLNSALVSAAEFGAPPGRTWTHRQLRADENYPKLPFSWMVQGRSGLLYLADQSGVLEYDGAQWRRLPLPSDTSVSALGLDHRGDLIVGGGELLQRITWDGDLMMVEDIGAKVPGTLRGFGNFWEIATDGKIWCARSEPALVCETSSGIHVHGNGGNDEFGRLFEANGELLVPRVFRGMQRVTSEGLEDVPELRPMSLEGVYTIVAPRPGKYLALTKEMSGIWTWSKGQAPQFQASSGISGLAAPIGQGVVIGDGLIAFPEENGVVVIMDDSGRIIDRLHVPDATVGRGAQALLKDREGGLWIVWRNAITRTEYPSRLSLFALPVYDASATYRIARTNWGITTHFGEELFALKQNPNSNSWEMHPVEGKKLPIILFVDVLHGREFAGTISGLYDLQTMQRLKKDVYAYSIAPMLTDPRGMWLGLRFSVSDIGMSESGEWVERSRQKNVSFEVNSMLQTDTQTLWLGSDVGRAARLSIPLNGNLSNSTLQEFDAEHGLPESKVDLHSLDGRMIVATQSGVLEFNGSAFVPNSRFPFSETGSILQLQKIDENQVLVVGPKSRMRLLQEDIYGVFRHVPGVFDQIVGIGNIGFVAVDPDGIVWLSTDMGLIRVDPKVQLPKSRPEKVVIRELNVNDRQIPLRTSAVPEVPEASSMRVTFALPSFRDPEENQYRSRLRINGADGVWGPWTNEYRRDFTNLPAGSVVFEVEARDATGQQAGVAAINLMIVAPWYKRAVSIVGFVIAGVILLLLAVQWRVRALRARSAELERLVAIKTEALQIAATTDPLTGLWNRHRFGQWMRDEVPKINAQAGAADDDERVDLITCVIDLDHFKRVNDQHGHAAGDAVLKAVAERLLALRENGDLVFRFGGEEFVYLGVNRHRSEGKKLAEKIVHEIAQINVELESGVLLDPTASVGWSVYPFYREKPELFTLDFVLGVADRALYLAKQVGRNRAYGYVANISVDELDRTQADWRTQVFNRHTDFLKRV